MKETGKCCICKGRYVGFGHNPSPVMEELNKRACHKCNSYVVIPARIRELYQQKEEAR